MTRSKDVDAYIAAFPPRVRTLLRQMRSTIRASAPDAEERISYGIPTFRGQRNLVHFAAFAHHIGFYPGASGIARFKRELAHYKGAKGSVQFPLAKPLPLDLIEKIVAFRVGEDTRGGVTKDRAAKSPAKGGTKLLAARSAHSRRVPRR
jgi:uncharacterized protein YdhG (YjbR/CyaY superfamily)